MEAVILGLVVLIAAWLIIKRRKPKERALHSPNIRSTQNAAAPRSRYRATSITAGKNACEIARAIDGKRFRDTENVTPTLPLPGCDAPDCSCTYQHFEDRRDSDEDRRLPNNLKAQLYETQSGSERRARHRGRRKSDWA